MDMLLLLLSVVALAKGQLPGHCVELAPIVNGNQTLIVYSNAFVRDANGTFMLPRGTVATYNCTLRFSLVGASQRTCQQNDTWSGTDPSCQVTCFKLSEPVNGRISYNNSSRIVGTVAIYTCDTGFTLNGGSTTRTCQSDGEWSGSAPTCDGDGRGTVTESMTTTQAPMITCSDLMVPSNGMISYNGGSTNSRPVGAVATYSCETGYILNRGSIRTCQSDGTWSGSAPTCEAISCGPPPDISNGSLTLNNGTMIGGVVTYSCDMGFVLLGLATVACLSTGAWGSPPVCETPPPVYLSLSSTNYLSGLPEIPLSSVGEGRGSALVCHTDLNTCCQQFEQGGWYYPNASVISTETEGSGLYVTRDEQMVSLNRRISAEAPAGFYCCVMPTSDGNRSSCINLTVSTPPSLGVPGCDNVALLAVAVLFILIALVMSGVVIVMSICLALKHKKVSKTDLASKDATKTEGEDLEESTYETMVPATYTEVPSSSQKFIRGGYKLSQIQAYSTSGCVAGNDYVEEDIYDN